MTQAAAQSQKQHGSIISELHIRNIPCIFLRFVCTITGGAVAWSHTDNCSGIASQATPQGRCRRANATGINSTFAYNVYKNMLNFISILLDCSSHCTNLTLHLIDNSKAVWSSNDFLKQYNRQNDLGKNDSGHCKPFQSFKKQMAKATFSLLFKPVSNWV